MAVDLSEDPTTNELLLAGVTRDPDAPVWAIPDSFGGWFDLTAGEFQDRVRSLARGLLAAGTNPGDAVAVLSSSRFETTLIDFATASIGAAVVPLSREWSQSDTMAVLDEARVQAVVVETPSDFARIDELHGDLPLVGDVWQIGLGDLDKLAALGRSTDDIDDTEATSGVSGVTVAALFRDENAEGPLRLVPITQRALVARATALAEALGLSPDDAILQILPTTDVQARVTTLMAVAGSSRIGHLADPARLIETSASFRPTLLVGYPGTVDVIDEAARARADASGRGAALRQGLEVAVDHSIALDAGALSRGLRTRFALADALVYRGLRKAVGGRLRALVAISNETSLTARMRHIMRSLDVRPLEGYGTLSTTGLATVETPDDPFDRPVGGVGAPLRGVEVRVDSAGAVAFRGVGVAGDDSAGEWLLTDEFGFVDGGRLVIEGRDAAG